MKDDLVEKVARAMWLSQYPSRPWRSSASGANSSARIEFMALARPAVSVVLEEAAKVARLAPHNRGGMICVCSEGLADWIAEATLALGEK